VFTELRCVVGLGANVGDMLATFESTVELLTRVGYVESVSHLYESAPVGGPAQPDYFNAAVLLRSSLEPRGILEELLSIERYHGRVRGVRWGPRLLDLDLLWIDGVIVDEPGLKVPHPRLVERNFALFPLVDVAPDAREPNTGRAYSEMRKNHRSQAIRLHGFARPRTDDWLADSRRNCLWQMADLGT
jgi:2-amino-4-hydroxy-6-hydroxymethyldihydropteridine diphosphokinase